MRGKKTNRIDEINRVRGAIIVACLGILNLLKQTGTDEKGLQLGYTGSRTP